MSHASYVCRLITVAGHALTCAACARLLGFDDVRLASPDAGASCHHRAPPPRPKVSSGSGAALDLVFVLNTIDTGNTFDNRKKARYPGLGFDLDLACTGEGQAGTSCVEPKSATANHDDGIDGVDNALGQLVFNPNAI